MIRKLFKYVKKYGLINVIVYILKKINNKFYLKTLERKCLNNQIKIKYSFLEDFNTDLNFFFNKNSKEKILNFYSENLNLKENILKDSEKIINHIFSFLADKEYSLGKNINWNQDFKSGFIWENKFYKKIKVVDLNNNSDVKIPWELSRFQHIFTLGKAYWITNDKKYYIEFRNQICDWVEKNPIYMTVNWTCTMDVAIRAVNWIFGYFLFEDLIKGDKEFLKLLNNSLYNHGKYIIKNLEKGLDYANNHYLSDLGGLVFLGLYFKKLNNAEVKHWLKFSIRKLEKEMFIENNPDGTNYETSTSYHRLVIELMFYPMYLCELNNINFTENYKKRLEKMFEFMGKITKSNGHYPLIGDVDNGRLVILSNYYDWKINDCKHILSIGGEYFNNQFLKEIGAKELEDKLWINNSNNIYKERFYKQSSNFPNGGYYLLQNENIYCLIRCGELSLKGQGGHSHNDQLSFELNVLGEDFIIDIGTGVYTADKNIRNLFRSTIVHNTVTINNIEQNDFDETNLFSMPEQTFSKCLKFSDNEFEGEHQGYLNKANVIHNRKIVLEENSLAVFDNLENQDGIISLNLALGTNIYEKTNEIILEKNGKKITLKLKDNNYEIVDSFISLKYGEIKKSKRIEICFKNKYVLKFEVGESYGN